jgi:glycosyltransferase involved in cell wall biosynthesis
MPRRILLHAPSLAGGGAERVIVLMANELAARGHDVTLLTWNGTGPNGALRSPQVQLVDFDYPIIDGGFGKPATVKGLWRMGGVIRRCNPEIVYSGPEFANLVMACALYLAGSRAAFFPSFHAAADLADDGIGSRLAIMLRALIARRATRAIAVSAGVGREVAASGFPQRKVAVINNPLPFALGQETGVHDWQAALAAMGDGPVIATAGRFVAVKDHRTLLDAFSRLLARRPARLVLFGDGPLGPELRAHAEALGIAGRVLFPGYVSEPAACYAAADLFVLSSTSEGFGNVLIEAMAAGVPVVSTDAPHGPREILADGDYGALVPVGDADALARAMAEMLDHPTAAAKLRHRAADFSIERIGDQYEALLLQA